MYLIWLSAALLVAFLIVSVALVRARRRSALLSDELARAMRESLQHQTALQQRKQLDNLKDEFISTVSHELRTPLTSIHGALGLLSSGKGGLVDEKAGNLLRIANSNTERLVRLINDILDLERMESGRAPLQIRRLELREVVAQAVETMRSMAEKLGVTLEIVPEPAETPICVRWRSGPHSAGADESAVECGEVFAARRSGEVCLTASDGENLVLQVVDAGRGVPQDKLETIFDRFGQVEASDARQKGGTGLGLAICRSIVAQHGGTIWAERNDTTGKGPGTTVILRLPRYSSVEQTAALPAASEGSILVVDDDPIVRNVVREHLRRNGYTVIETASGEEALEAVSKQHVDAVLLDLCMPGMSGWETLERLKKNELTAEIPVVVLSVLSPATRTPDVPTTQGWVQKPFHETLLLTEISRALHPTSGPGRILLVEDDEDLATVVLSGFRTIGAAGAGEPGSISVDHVSSLAEAESYCQERAPDLLILDLTLRDGSGFALVDWLRRQPKLSTLPLVVYSGSELSEAEMAQLRLGPTQFLTKARVQPRHVEDLILAMVRHLGKPAMGSVSA